MLTSFSEIFEQVQKYPKWKLPEIKTAKQDDIYLDVFRIIQLNNKQIGLRMLKQIGLIRSCQIVLDKVYQTKRIELIIRTNYHELKNNEDLNCWDGLAPYLVEKNQIKKILNYEKQVLKIKQILLKDLKNEFRSYVAYWK